MKVGIVIYEKLIEKYDLESVITKVLDDILKMSRVGGDMFYIILPEKGRYHIVNRVMDEMKDKDIEIVFREMYGDDGGGGLVSFIPFIHHNEKIIVMEPFFKYSEYIYEYISLAIEKHRYSALFISRNNIPPFIALYRDRVTYSSLTRDKKAKYSYVGVAILNYNFFSKINELISIYPDLHVSDLSRVFNLFLSKGGVFKAEYLSPGEWKLVFSI